MQEWVKRGAKSMSLNPYGTLIRERALKNLLNLAIMMLTNSMLKNIISKSLTITKITKV